MADHFQDVYKNKADLYDAMVSCEDYEGHILPALQAIRPLDGLDVVEMGAGTGRLTRLLAPHVKSIKAFDIEPAMLEQAQKRLESLEKRNWQVQVGDNRALPAESSIADIAIAGWSFGHGPSWYPDTWKIEIGKAIGEMQRVLRPGGTAIIIETMGTGNEHPAPPHERLARYLSWLESEQGFSYTWIRTDYKFESVEEADQLTRFFFGDELADHIVRERLSILPECTGVWWKHV